MSVPNDNTARTITKATVCLDPMLPPGRDEREEGKQKRPVCCCGYNAKHHNI